MKNYKIYGNEPTHITLTKKALSALDSIHPHELREYSHISEDDDENIIQDDFGNPVYTYTYDLIGAIERYDMTEAEVIVFLEGTGIPVSFLAGEGNHFSGGVNYMTTPDRSVYAECPVPACPEEDYGYFALKKAILSVHPDPASLRFLYDGQEEYLSADAFVDCDVYIERDLED